MRHHQFYEKQPEYGNLLRQRHFAAKKRPAGDGLASSEKQQILLLYYYFAAQ